MVSISALHDPQADFQFTDRKPLKWLCAESKIHVNPNLKVGENEKKPSTCATRKDRQITKVEFDEFDVSEDNGRFIATVGGTIHALINGSEHESEVHYKIHGMKVNGQIKITSIDRM